MAMIYRSTLEPTNASFRQERKCGNSSKFPNARFRGHGDFRLDRSFPFQLILILFLQLGTLAGCSNGDFATPAEPPRQANIEVTGIAANPAVVYPGQNATLSVTATGTSTLSYAWHATDGSLSTSNASTTIWTAPGMSGTYTIAVDVTNDTGLVRAYVTVFVAASYTGPVITSILPAEARAGDSVRISGQGFGSTQGSSTLTIGGAAAIVTSWTDSGIQAQIPNDANTGTATVTVSGAASNDGRFVLLWPSTGNVAVTVADASQNGGVMVSDGNGGAIIAWVDHRSDDADIYAQRTDNRGTALWTANGVAICTAADSQVSPRIASDGAGGAIIVWADRRNGTDHDLFAQRIDASGALHWTADGVAVVNEVNEQSSPQIAADGSGGAVIVWEDQRDSAQYDIYAQRVDAAGSAQWVSNGVAVTAAANHQFAPRIIVDAMATVVWEDYRSGTNFDIYAQRLDLTGVVQWTADGVVVTDAAANQTAAQVIAGTAGAVIVVWQDDRSGANFDIYAQQLASAGTVAWTANGTAVSTDTGNQNFPQIATDGAGGAIIGWEDDRNGNFDIYMQRLNASGVVQWTANGIAAATGNNAESSPRLVPDDAGGVFLAWQDNRAGNADIYAQRFGPSGVALWGATARPLSDATGDQTAPRLVTDGAGGIVGSWDDSRNATTSSDIYAQGISASGR